MDNIEDILIALGYENQVVMTTAINTIDDRFGEGSANRSSSGKSWGDATESDWRNDPSLIYVAEGNDEEILDSYIELRRNGIRGWLSITTKNWQSFSLWKPS